MQSHGAAQLAVQPTAARAIMSGAAADGSPYTFVRRGGRAGSCIANTYKRGAEFLLMLAKTDRGFTVNWYALGPVNEQLRSSEDPWLRWVRNEVKR